MVEVRCTGILQLSCGPRESGQSSKFSDTGDPALDACTTAPQPKESDPHGRDSWLSRSAGFPYLASFIPIPICASTLGIRGKSRMQQFCTCGSVRGASGQLASLPRPETPEVEAPAIWLWQGC